MTGETRLTLSLERVQLVEERGNVYNDTGTDEASTLLVDQTWSGSAKHFDSAAVTNHWEAG